MKKILVMLCAMSISCLFRLFLVFFCYTKIVRHYWPTDTTLYSFEIIFLLFSSLFWLSPSLLTIKKLQKNILFLLVLSFFPEILMILGVPFYFFIELREFSVLDVFVYFSFPIFALSEISFGLTWFICKKTIIDCEKK